MAGTEQSEEISAGLPKGVPVMAWLNGDDRERKRLVRIARG
ncbi:hypothetical protein [Sphingomonas oligophenolica]|nr:hypothetical protein [Sphingomonas oligophenolica]